MSIAVENKMFVCFITNVIDAMSSAQPIDGLKCGLGIHRPRGIIRRNGHYCFSFTCNRCSHCSNIPMKIRSSFNQNGFAPRHGNCHLMIKIIRRLQNNFISMIRYGENSIVKPHIRTRRDYNPIFIAYFNLVFSQKLLRNCHT